MDWSEKTAALVERAHEDRDWYEAMAGWLVRPDDLVAVDVGCGGGGMTLALAAALGRPGQVAAVDSEPQVLAAVGAEIAAARSGASFAEVTLAEVTLVTADLHGGVGPVREALSGPADLIWASASVHHVGDQQAAVDTLASLLGPGGRLALAEGGLSARYLPWDVGVGQPGLEVRLEAANNQWFARMRAELPGSTPMPYGWTEALRRAGLVDVTTRTTLGERPAPLPEPECARLVERLTQWVDRLRPTELVDPADLAAWDRLLDPDDPAWLGRRTDLFELRARSVHRGVKPGRAA